MGNLCLAYLSAVGRPWVMCPGHVRVGSSVFPPSLNRSNELVSSRTSTSIVIDAVTLHAFRTRSHVVRSRRIIRGGYVPFVESGGQSFLRWLAVGLRAELAAIHLCRLIKTFGRVEIRNFHDERYLQHQIATEFLATFVLLAYRYQPNLGNSASRRRTR